MKRLCLALVVLLSLEMVVALPAAGAADDCDRTVHLDGYTDVEAQDNVWGTDANERIFGTAGDDQLYGGGGDDILCGLGGFDYLNGDGPDGVGADRLYGGPGNDRIDAGPGDDHLLGGADQDSLNGHDGSDYLYGEADADRLEGYTGDDHLYGGAGIDILDYSCTAAEYCGAWLKGTAVLDGQNVNMVGSSSSGGQGTDLFADIEVVRGSPGADTLTGRDGQVDEFLPSPGGDTIDGRGAADGDILHFYTFDDAKYAPVDGAVTVDVDLTTGQAHHPLNPDVSDTVTSIEVVYGSAHRDRLVGGPVREEIDGRAGDDLIEGNSGHDLLSGGAGIDTLRGGDENDHLNGGPGDDSLFGGAGIDFLEGEEHNDTIDGGTEFDVLDYRCSSVRAFCQNLVEGQSVDLTAPQPASSGGQGLDTFSNIESVRGSSADDHFIGTAGTDYFWPGLGADKVNASRGADYIDYTRYEDDPNDSCDTSGSTSTGVAIDLTAGTAVQNGVTDTLVGIEHVIGSALDDTIVGSDAVNTLWGGCGDDVLKGAGGDDVLEGDAGDDALHGGLGRDVVSFDGYAPAAGTQGVRVHLGAGTALADGSDSLFGIETVVGSGYDDILTGSRRADVLIGGMGNDDLWGREGADVLMGNGLQADPDADHAADDDRLIGGLGADTADFSNAAARVVVDLKTQEATGDGADVLESIEAVKGSRFGDTLRGDIAANYLYGGQGADTLIGRAGDDYMDGQAGADKAHGGPGARDVVDYSFSASQVDVNLATGAGSALEDGVSRAERWTEVEVVAGTAGKDVMRGDGLRNYLAGESGGDTLLGAAGSDFLYGAKGVDALKGQAGSDSCNGTGTETDPSCERTLTGRPTWHKRIGGLRTFRSTGDDQFLSAVDDVVEELRRLHRRRLHRRRLHH